MLAFKLFSTFFGTLLMIVIVIPLLSVLLGPFIVYRAFIQFLAKIFKRDLIELVNPRDCIFANDKISTKPNSTILFTNFMEGNPEIETLRNTILKNVFGGSVCSFHSNQKFPQLLQYFENWCGFVFRKWEEDFDIRNHVKEWEKGDNLPATPHDLYNLRRKLLSEPYKCKTSAWEIVVVRNYEDVENKLIGSVFLCKFHHGVLDGFSLIKLCIQTNSFPIDISSIVPQSISKPLTLVQSIVIYAKLFTQAVKVSLSILSKSLKNDPANIFYPNLKLKCKLTGRRHPVNNRIPTKIVKDTAKQTRTSYTAVIMAGLTGGIRNYLLDKKLDVPKSVDLTIPLPWPGHMDKIQNHFTLAEMEIPTGIPDQMQRLFNLQNQLEELKKSSVPALNYVTLFLIGLLPNPLMSFILKDTPSSILFSSLPGPNTPTTFIDQKTCFPLFEGGFGKGGTGMGVSMLSYDGGVAISILPDEAIFPEKMEAEAFLRCIINEIQLLHDSSFV